MSITSSQNTSGNNSEKKPGSATATQTDPIMLPFPLPPIGFANSGNGTQTEYTWMFNEFPIKQVSGSMDNFSSSIKTLKQVEGLVSEFPRKFVAPILSNKADVDALAVFSPKKRSSPKKVISKEVTAAPIEVRPVHIAPVMSDSSDDEATQLLKPVVLTRTITPQSIKPNLQIAVPVATPDKIAVPVSSSSSEDEGVASSSSESDADVPAVSSISNVLSKKRKAADIVTPVKKSSRNLFNSTPPALEMTLKAPVRMGPFVQINDTNESEMEAIRSAMLALVPEATREGAIKEAVFDEANSRLIFQLRISPKIVQYFIGQSVQINDHQSMQLNVLTESQKKMAIPFFKQTTSPKKTNM